MSKHLRGGHQVRMNPEETWTALDHMNLCTIVDAELALTKAELLPKTGLVPDEIFKNP